MTGLREHSYISTLKQNFAEGKVDRREFLRTSTLLGLSAGAAYAFVGKVTGQGLVKSAKAAMPTGGTLRIGMRVLPVTDPHTFAEAWLSDNVRGIIEPLTKTGNDNVTRPLLLEGWEASDDLKTWTLHVRKDIKWHNGRAFDADDVIWNLNHVLDASVGSSVLGLMKGYMLNEVGEGDAKTTELWDANAIERVDSHTVRLNCKAAQLAVPEHLFHYPLHMLDPEEGGLFGVGSNGTGGFELVEHTVGQKSIIKSRGADKYWGEGPYLDQVEFHDLGDDPSASLGALASKQVHGLYAVDVLSIDTVKGMTHINLFEANTTQTGIARMKPVGPFADPRVRKAMRLAIDTNKVLQVAYRGFGSPGEHHHVSPIHPEYAKLPFMGQDIAAAKALLAEAGHPDGISATLAVRTEPWHQAAVQAMVEMWKEAGIKIDLNVIPKAQYWEIWNKVPFGFTQWTHRPLGIMVLGLAYRSGVPWNESDYANPEFDRLLSKAEGTLDVEKRREIMREIEIIMQEDGPLVQPLWRSVFTAYDKRVKGFSMHPTSYIFPNELALEA